MADGRYFLISAFSFEFIILILSDRRARAVVFYRWRLGAVTFFRGLEHRARIMRFRLIKQMAGVAPPAKISR